MPEFFFTDNPRPTLFAVGELQIPPKERVVADSWLSAKDRLGFPLTALQKQILAGQADQFAILGHFASRSSSGKTYGERWKVSSLSSDATQAFLARLAAMPLAADGLPTNKQEVSHDAER